MNGDNLLQDLVNLLKPFFDATELLSGSKYTTLNFVYPTIYFLMEKFSISNKSDNELFDLIYSSEQKEENTPDANANIDAQNRNLPISDDEDSETNSEDELVRNSIVEPRLSRISLRGARGRGQGRGRGKKVEAACYLSMKEYWNVPTLTGIIATILDPRLKKLKFVNNSVIKNETIEKLRRLYSNEKFENELNAITTSCSGSASNVHQATNTSSSSNLILSALFDDDDDVEQDIDEDRVSFRNRFTGRNGPRPVCIRSNRFETSFKSRDWFGALIVDFPINIP
ncbi:unnamed protein product [Rhizophagus irregularis]|nr:unnamed protein product [Rhizophagus irregularis]